MTGAPHSSRISAPERSLAAEPGRDRNGTSFSPAPSTDRSPALLTDQLPGVVWITNLEQRVTRACGNCLSYFTRDGSFVPGTPLHEFFQSQDPDFPPIRAHRLAKGGYAAPFEFTRERHFIGVTEPIFDGVGNPIGTISLAQDQTDYKVSQQNQRVQFLRNLTGGLATHFNNWLTNVMGYTALALAKLPPRSDARKILEQIEASSRCMGELVEEMMAYSQSRKLHPEPLHFSCLIEEVRPQLSTVVAPGTQINLELAKDLPLLFGDHGLLRNLVLKLVCAAAEMIGQNKGSITLRTQVVRMTHALVLPPFHKDEVPEGEYIWLQVAASHGVDGGKVEHLFEPFSNTRSSGHGLGLASAKGIVALHRGVLTAAPAAAGGGLVFHALLPTRDNTAPTANSNALEKTEEIDLAGKK